VAHTVGMSCHIHLVSPINAVEYLTEFFPLHSGTAEEQGDDRANQKDDEKDFRNPSSPSGDSTKTKDSSDDRDDKKYYSVMKHTAPFYPAFGNR